MVAAKSLHTALESVNFFVTLQAKQLLMKRLTLLTACLLLTILVLAQPVIVVKRNDAQSLLDAIREANERNAAVDAERLYILIPDGYYDLGQTALTRISGHNVAVVGQSMQGTVIRNAPDVKNESISNTAVFQYLSYCDIDK